MFTDRKIHFVNANESCSAANLFVDYLVRGAAIFESLFPNHRCHQRRREQGQNRQSGTSFPESATSLDDYIMHHVAQILREWNAAA
jgi:hypothetical protein